jgi:hypothetical protein
LVSKHEVGGTKQQDILRDADSVSFFENNTEHFITEKAGELGRGKVKEKLDWMFERVTFQDAKNKVKIWYEESLKKLGY